MFAVSFFPTTMHEYHLLKTPTDQKQEVQTNINLELNPSKIMTQWEQNLWFVELKKAHCNKKSVSKSFSGNFF